MEICLFSCYKSIPVTYHPTFTFDTEKISSKVGIKHNYTLVYRCLSERS